MVISTTADKVYTEYTKEFGAKPHGAMTRTAKTLGLSRQRVEQIALRFGKLKGKIRIKLFVCRMCEHELEVSEKAKNRRSVCAYCDESGIKKCTCGTLYFGKVRKCSECQNKIMTAYYAKVKSEGGEKWKHLQQKRHGYSLNYRKNNPDADKIRQREKRASGVLHDTCSCGNRKGVRANRCRTCYCIGGSNG